VSRPPRLVLHAAAAPRHVAALNVSVLGRVSHQLNTFPSGHVAVSLAAAAIVGSVSPVPAVLLGAVAAAIGVGAAAGRYHYVVDVLVGAGVAAAAVATAW
jgi:membrane-associated phospholipid phosphatase